MKKFGISIWKINKLKKNEAGLTFVGKSYM